MKNSVKSIVIILSLIFFNISHSLEKITIKYKINNMIITNFDIENEAKYLMALNTQLKTLNKNQLNTIASSSILKEKIKKIAIDKNMNLNQDTKYFNSVVKNFYTTLNLNSEDEFKTYLEDNDLTLDLVKNKIQIETAWNQLVYKKFERQIKINQNLVNKKFNETKLNTKTKKYLFSEILFSLGSEKSLEAKKKLIFKSIDEIGFKNTANLYSISDSAKFGGSTGWVEKSSLSKKILKKIENLSKDSISSPIQIGNNFLILKIDEIKEILLEVDKDQLLNKIILNEREKQLQQLSKSYFNKIKINTQIDEY
tara:strand:- start:2082 stop:3014 length:933 start_codon:yes stop_codon:yes gene_type:complete